MNVQLAKMLIIEDDENDLEILMLTLKKAKLKIDTAIARTGEEALEYLKNNSPDLILLDLRLPGIGGFDVLAVIKKDQNLNQIPVVILTGSDQKENVAKSYELKAQCFLKKPLEVIDFINIVISFKKFEFALVLT